MTTYTVTAPDGNEYDFDYNGDQDAALAAFKQHWQNRDPGITDASRSSGWKAPFQALDDTARIVADTASRGYLDKWLGPQDQAKTEMARQRAGWASVPTDIGTAIETNPFGTLGKVASTAYGAGEGALTAYGHQKGWMPDWGEIAKGAAIGGGLGYGGAKVVDALGNPVKKAIESSQAADAPFRQSAQEAADIGQRGTPAQYGEGLRQTAQAGKLDTLRNVKASTRQDFATEMANAGKNWTPAEQAAIDAVSGGNTVAQKLGNNAVTDWITSHGAGSTLGAEAIARMFGIPPGVVTGGRLLAGGVKAATSKIDPGQIENIASIIRDPAGGGFKTDPATVEKLRNAFANIGIGTARHQEAN